MLLKIHQVLSLSVIRLKKILTLVIDLIISKHQRKIITIIRTIIAVIFRYYLSVDQTLVNVSTIHIYIYIYICIYTCIYIYIYIYVYIQDIHNEKTDYIFENIFRLMSLSIHSLFTIKTATKILSYYQSVTIIVGNQ